MIQYKTEKLPTNFVILGAFLFIISIWRMILLDWAGIVILLFSIPLLFTRSGLLIDPEKLKLRKYIGLFFIRTGKWESISGIKHLRIIRVQQTRGMAVLSIARNETNVVYKLILVMPNENIEILVGENDFIVKAAKQISSVLNVEVFNTTVEAN